MTGTLSDRDRREIVLFRMEKAESTYREALVCLKENLVNASANRLYYSAYYAIAALLIANGISARTHNGIKSMFAAHFIKTKLIDVSFMTILSRLMSLRMTGDYEDRKNLNMDEDIKPLIEPTRELVDVVTKLAKECL